MKNALAVVLFRLFLIGVFADGTETSDVESVSVMVGDSVTLKSGVTEIQTDEGIDWRFSGSRIARISSGSGERWVKPDGSFKDRLQLDSQTGDLKISNIKTTDSGQYKLRISSPRGSPEMTFTLIVASADEAKTVNEGDSVTLRTDVTDIQTDDVIQWRFGQQESLVAEINRKARIFNTYDGADGRFRDRLKLDHQTGSLTIRDITAAHSGVYEADISSSRYTIHKSFNVTVRDVMVLVMAGDSVTLHTDFPMKQNKHVVSWFDYQNSPVNDVTGDLTIRNIRRDQSGKYTVKIISSSTMDILRIFHINVTGVFSSEKDGEKTVSVVNGDSFTLYSNVTDIQNDSIEWMFRPQNLFIAKTDGKSKKTSYNNGVIFKNKVYLDIKTGDLSINNSSTEHAGLYQLKIINSRYTIQKNFIVTVSGSGLSPATIVWIVVGVIVLLVAAAVAGVIYHRKKQPKMKEIVLDPNKDVNLLEFEDKLERREAEQSQSL